MRKASVCIGVAVATLAVSTTARADGAAPAPAPAPAPESTEARPTTAREPPPPPPTAVRADRGRFSGKRLVVEMLAGAVVGSLAGVGMYKAAGGDGIGAVLAGLGANLVVTPLAAWGAGTAMGGRGTLGWTYIGGLAAFASPAATPEQVAVSFAVGMVLMPVTSAIFYEVSSHVHSKRFEAIAGGIAVAPVVDQRGISGVRAGLTFGF